MQDYIIFGAGVTGKNALYFLGYNRVLCFVDNICNKKVYENKKVISFNELLLIDKSEYILVIASEKYNKEMEKQAVSVGIDRYFVFRGSDIYKINEYLPFYFINRKTESITYTNILSKYPVRKYKNIVIYGFNPFLPYIISEIAMISDIKNICCILTLNKNITFEKICGIHVTSDKTMLENADCIIVNVRHNQNSLYDFINSLNVDIIDIYNTDIFIDNYKFKNLYKLKNIYEGRRIFLIGNGPSMTIKDLNILHNNNEICIAFNKIYRIFDETLWRPNYIAMTDMDVIVQVQDEILKYKIPLIIADRFNQCIHYNVNFDDQYYVHLIDEQFYPYKPRFSDDIVNGVYLGASSVYDVGIQFAAYMGASEIYLIGVDNSFTGNVTDEANHFIKGYYREDEKILYKEHNRTNTCNEAEIAYQSAENYSRKHGFRIYNATRGGKLEVFERVNFDDLFSNQKEEL